MYSSIKKLTALLMCVVTICFSAPPIQSLAASTGSSAANHSVGADTAQSASTTYDDNVVISDNGVTTSNTDVYITVDDSGIKVGVPTAIILGGVPDATGAYAGKNTGRYSVSVEGDIAGTEKLVVEPDNTSVTLSQTGNTNTPTATITQEQTEFNFQNLWDEVVVTGVIASQEPLTAGKWHGSFNFDISLDVDYGRAIQSWDISASSNDDVTMTYYQPETQENTEPVTGFANLTSNLFNLFRPMTAWADDIQTYEDGTVVISGTGNMKENINTLFYDLEAEQAYVDSLLANNLSELGPEWPEKIQNNGPGHIKVLSHLSYQNLGAFNITEDHVTLLKDVQNYVMNNAPSNINEPLFIPSNVIIKPGVTNISSGAFDKCNNIENVTLPDSITNIGDGAFIGCSSLRNIILPSGLTIIGNSAFKNCSQLTNVEVPRNANIRFNIYCFEGCSSLTFLDLKNSASYLGNIGTNININFDSLEDLGRLGYDFYNNMIYNKPPFKIYINNVALEGKFVLPANFNSNLCLDGYSYITSVTIPGNYSGIVTFSNCDNVTSVKFLNGATNVAQGMFSGCDSLSEVYLPSSIASIGNNAFKNIAAGSTIYCQNKSVSALLNKNNYTSADTTAVVDATQFS